MNSALNNFCKEKLGQVLSYYDFKILMDHYAQQSGKPGLSILYSLLSCDNFDALLEADKKINQEMSEHFDPLDNKRAEFDEKLDALKRKYTDRDEQGNPIVNEFGQPRMSEFSIEFDNDFNTLKTEYADVLTYSENRESIVMDYLNSHYVTVNIVLFNNILDYPRELEPAVVKIYSKCY